MRVTQLYYWNGAAQKVNYQRVSVETYILAECCLCTKRTGLQIVVDGVYLCGFCSDLMNPRTLVFALSNYISSGSKEVLVRDLKIALNR